MLIGQKLKEIRESKNLSQGDIEERTGLLRCYTSRVENGHTVPSVETLEKYASALEVPLYKLFYDGKGPIRGRTFQRSTMAGRCGCWWEGTSRTPSVRLRLSGMNDRNRKLLFAIAQRLASRSRPNR